MREKTFKPWALALSMVAMLTPCVVDAAGLGRLAVMSGLGQPLNAEIELLAVQKGESVVARLASVETYQQANLQYNPALVGTRLTVEKRPNGQLYLKATTPKPVSEPFLELVVELSSEHGRVTRQYTILLDPPGYGRGVAELPPPAVAAAPAPRAPAVQSPELSTSTAPAAPATEAASAPEVSADMASGSVPPPAPRVAATRPITTGPARASASLTPNQYGPIKAGETLTAIARSIMPEGATLEQTLVGLYRNNPEAFIKKNMNLVRSGKILRVPDAAELTAVTHRDAAREIHVQVADFNAMRGQLADGASAAREEGSVASGRITARIGDAGSSEPRDTVRLSKGEPPTGKAARSGSSADRVRALEEEAVAREKALSEANQRISQLEKTIKDMQRLAELKGSAGAASVQPTDKSAAPAAVPAAGKGPIATSSVVTPEPPKAAQPAKSAPPTVTAEAPKKDGAKAIELPKAAVDAPKLATETTKAAPAKDAATQPVAKAKATVPPTPVQSEPDLLETIMNEPLYLAAGGAALLLGGVGLVMARRRRKSRDELKDDEKLVKIAPKLGSVSAATAAGATALAASNAGRTAAAADVPKSVDAKPAVVGKAAASVDTDLSFGADEDSREDEDEIRMQQHTAKASAQPGGPDLRVAQMQAAGAGRAGSDSTLDTTRFDEDAVVAHAPSSVFDDPSFQRAQEESEALAPAFDLSTSGVGAAGLDTGEEARAGSTDPLAVDFDLSAPETATHKETAIAHGGRSVDDFNLDPLPAIDTVADTTVGERASGASDTMLHEFKLDDLDLNLGGDPLARGGSKDDHWYDVQQKFDLAKAYEEMGDKDGARDILQEVVKEGDAQQQEQAKKLLGALS